MCIIFVRSVIFSGSVLVSGSVVLPSFARGKIEFRPGRANMGRGQKPTLHAS